MVLGWAGIDFLVSALLVAAFLASVVPLGR